MAVLPILENEQIFLRGLVGSVDGKKIIRKEITGHQDDAQQLGLQLAEQLLASGAKEILAEVYNRSMTEVRLLVTRFAPHAQRLTDLLNKQGIFAIAQPLLAVQKTDEFDNPRKLLANFYDYIIAVSPNAVDYTDQALAGINWPQTNYLAVGKGTQTKLKIATAQNVVVPKRCFDSEGLLDLPALSDLQGKHILIVRGVGGRELLCDTLTKRGAVVDYYQPYQRVAIELSGD